MSQPLSRTLAIELLDKASNPDHSTYNDFDDDDPEPEVTFDLLKITLPNIEVIVFLLDFIFFPWNHTLLSLFISSQSTIYSPHLLSFLSLWYIAHLSALCHIPSSSSSFPLFSFSCLIPSIFPFSFPSCLSYSILLALLCSLFLTLVFLCPPSFLHSALVFTATPLTPAQFKYRGHFLPISPGARRAPRFAARRKVPVWAVVRWCHSNTNHAVNCFLCGGGPLKWLNRNWISIQLRDYWCCHGNWHRHGTFRLLMQKDCHIGVLEIQLFGSAASLAIWFNHFSTLLIKKKGLVSKF